MPLLGFSIGSSDNGDVGRSLDDIIADRRKEQARAVSGRPSKDKQSGTRNAKEKKTALADKSIATGRAKRAAAVRARRGLGDKKASAMEIEKEVYRQTRKTASAKKASEKKATNGRVPPNSSLREKKKAKKNSNDPPGALVGKMPQAKQVKAAIQGMELAGCPVPKGFQLVMQFTPVAANEKGKGKQPNANNNNNNKNKNNNNNNNNNTGNQKAGGRRKSGGRGRNN